MYKFELPERPGDAPQIGSRFPQLQFSDTSPDNVRTTFHGWAFTAFPNVEEQNSRVSVGTTRAMTLEDWMNPAHDDAFMQADNSREFCHLHQDGSFHAIVAPEIEAEVLAKNWGVKHPDYDENNRIILIYAPRDEEDLIVAKRVVTKSFEYASGRRIFDTMTLMNNQLLQG